MSEPLILRSSDWNILVVDDEEDVHVVTRLALRRRNVLNRPFTIVSAKSAREAQELLARIGPVSFDVALVDVVMESTDAGLKLCNYIRQTQPRSLRVILRTGQAGAAPEDRVMTDYDIDQYLAKGDLTEDRLFAAVRTGLRSSHEIATVLAIQGQMEGFARVIQNAGTVAELANVMRQSLKFMEKTYDAVVVVLFDVNDSNAVIADTHDHASIDRLRASVLEAHDGSTLDTIVDGDRVGLASSQLVIPFAAMSTSERIDGAREPPGVFEKLKAALGKKNPVRVETKGGLVVDFGENIPAERTRIGLQQDARLFLSNWALAYSTLCLQDAIAKARVTRAFAENTAAGAG